MSRYRKITTICCAAVFALGLAACGGGGDDGLNTSQEQELQNRVTMLQGQVSDLRARLGIDDDSDPGHDVASLQAEIDRLQGLLDDADEKAEEAALKAMVATAVKLHAGISAPSGDANGPVATDRAAAYNATDTAIIVSIGDGNNAPSAPASGLHTLSEDKKTTVAANHGWAGKRYADPAGGPMVEAMVYSNVEAPKQGQMFGSRDSAKVGTGEDDYLYTLVASPDVGNAVEVVGGTSPITPVAARVSFEGVTRTAGTETFKKKVSTDSKIRVPGSYHGVTGDYYCTPAANTCTATVAAKGFTLSTGDVWVFKPDNADARVMSAADTVYASYGWWIRKSADDKTYTASAFVDVKGTSTGTDDDDLASGLNGLNGTAKYMGGAAGKYALSSSTGGTNDAGHFTARAMLEANFTTNTAATAITGMIDMFTGADGESRNWSVKLNGSPITDAGGIGEAGDTTDDNAPTVWTIDGTAAKAAGEWTGNLRNNGTDGVPKTATGTFHSMYGTAGSMVGAFGVNKQ